MSRARRAAIGLLVLLSIVVLIATASFGALEAGVPIGGISRDQAIAIAARQGFVASGSQVGSALPGPLGMFGTDVSSSPYRLVWAVTFRGMFQAPSCGPYVPPPGKQHCPSPDHNATVILDYFTGDFVMGSITP